MNDVGVWPPLVLRGTAEALLGRPDWAADEAAVGAAHGLLAHARPRPAHAASLSDALTALPQLSWLRLSEAATTEETAASTTRATAAFAVLNALRLPAVVVVGGDADGRSGVAVGLPRNPKVRDGWSATHAPDVIWRDGDPPGWSVVTDPGHLETTWTCRTLPAEARTARRVPAPPGLEVLLAAATALGPWCVALVLRPISSDQVEDLRTLVSELEARVARHVTRVESLTQVRSSSIEDPRARFVAEALHGWSDLADDAARSGGWQVAAHLCSSSAQDLRALGAAFAWMLGPDVASSPERRRQAWCESVAAPGAPSQPGLLSSRDLADLLIPPRESVGTLQVRQPLGGGRQVAPTVRGLDVGRWLGTQVPAALDVDDLAGHCFVTGITGSGKSSTTRTLVAQLWNRHRIPFLVIDPAKSDYLDLAAAVDGGLTVVSGRDLRMNALAPWPGRPADEHIRGVSTALRGSFGMPMPVPYVASILLEELATASLGGAEVTLHDASARLDSLVEELAYQGEIRDNIRASLGLRLRLLLQPSRAERVAGHGPPSWLSAGPTVVLLGDLTDEEERTFVASLLVLYIADAARARGRVDRVRHVLVVEEAHRLMPEPRDASPEVGDPRAVSATLMTHLLAEVRAYGQSVVVVDQSPAAVARAVLRNTNVKLAHRVVDAVDQDVLAGAMGLRADEAPMLGSLGVGRCLVSTPRLLRPQTASVRPPEAGGEEPVPVLPPPADRGDPCHVADDATFHHASERHGSEMELAVALWAADGGSGNLIGRAQRLRLLDPAVRPACLISVGLRRHVATLVRIGHVDADQAVAYRRALWQGATAGQVLPASPSSGRRGPHGACSACPVPCLARPAVASGGLPGMRRLGGAGTAHLAPADVVLSAERLASAVEVEVGSDVSAVTAKLVGYCAAVHVCAALGASSALATVMRERLEDTG